MTTSTGDALVTFNEEKHEYRDDVGWIPGVTRVLSDMGYVKNQNFMTATSRIRGQMVHQTILLVETHCPKATTVEQVLERLDLGSKIIPYLEGYLAFKRWARFQVEKTEQLVYSPTVRVGGKFDLYGEMHGKKTLIDMKTWNPAPAKPKDAAIVQTAGYSILAREHLGLHVDQRKILAIPGNGDFRLYSCDEGSDEHEFRVAAYGWWYKARRSLIPMGGESEVEIVEEETAA